MKTRILPGTVVVAVILVAACAQTGAGQALYDWLPGQAFPDSLNSAPRAMTTWDPDGAGPLPELLVMGGSFTSAGGVSANHIVTWDGAAWQPLGSGMTDSVSALAVYNGQLIAAGDFSSAGGVTCNGIAAWDGTAWQPLGTGMTNGTAHARVYTLAVYKSQLIAGGKFTAAGGVACNYIAAWDGTAWQPLGSGVGATNAPLSVNALTVYDGRLIAGGYFATAGGIACSCIAAWDGTAWSPVSSGMAGGMYGTPSVSALAVYRDQLIAAGDFTSAGGTWCEYIGRWFGGYGWWPMSIDMHNIYGMTVYNDRLIVGAGLNYQGVVSNGITAWDSLNWFPMGTGLDGQVGPMAVYNGQLIVGGTFTHAGDKLSVYWARWAPVMTILQQPYSQYFAPGDKVTLSISVQATDSVTYQWRKGGVPLNDGSAISGSQSGTMTISTTSAADAGTYDVAITSISGNPTSNAATLKVTIATDASRDGCVDVVDLLYLADAFGAVPGDPNYNSHCDFNGDDSIDVVDLLMLLDDMGKSVE